MEKMTLKEIKRLVINGHAEDITTAESIPGGLSVVGYSSGVYGVNGALLSDNSGNMYAVTARCSNLFRVI